MYYKSIEHFFFTCKKLVCSKYEMNLIVENELKKFCMKCFELDENKAFKTSVCSMFYFNLKHEKLIGKSILEVLEEVFQASLKDCSEYGVLCGANELNFLLDIENTPKETIEELERVHNKSGIYYLYDFTKALIYIGKSKNLASRICSSYRERRATYFRYSLVENLSDMSILEIYLISKYKPKLNTESKSKDDPTIEIFEPNISEKFLTLNYEGS